MILSVCCFWWNLITLMLSPIIFVLLFVFYPILWISLKCDKLSFCVIKSLFNGFSKEFQEDKLKKDDDDEDEDEGIIQDSQEEENF
jgi:hypothetical protein